MSCLRAFVVAVAFVVTLIVCGTAVAAEPSARAASGRCPSLRAQAMRDLKDALRRHAFREVTHAETFVDFENYVDLDGARFCVDGPNGTWAVQFDWKKSMFATSTVPHHQALFVPWRLIYFDPAGSRHVVSAFNPFVAKVRNMLAPLRNGTATFGYYKVVPQLVGGDFDGSGREQVIVMIRWARWKADSGGSGDEEGSEFDLWPTERTLGRAYVFTGGRIQPATGTERLWIASAERCPQNGEWVIKTYGRFFRFEEASVREDGDLAYPVHGPLFRLYPASGGGLTLDDPRQLAHLKRACEEASRSCRTVYPPENMAILEAVCARVPGAASVIAHPLCADAYDAAQFRRPEGWLERWQRMPVDGVGIPSRTVASDDGCECSVPGVSSTSVALASLAQCTSAPLCGRYVVEDPGNGVDESGTGLVHDTTSGRRWLRFTSPSFTRHEEAVAYCARRGMRLPTRNEALRISAGRFCREAWPFAWYTWTSSAASEGRVWSVLYDGRDWELSPVAPDTHASALCVE